MEFSLSDFRSTDIFLPSTFEMRHSLNKVRYDELEQKFKKNKLPVSDALFRLKERTSEKYYNEVITAQTRTMAYSESVFPAYKFLMPEVLIDDWLSMMDPHREGRRDHSLHQPLTAYIISRLLGNCNPGNALVINGKSLLTECANMFLNHPKMEYLRQYLIDLYPRAIPPVPYARQRWAEVLFYQATMVSALFHDIGYPWQYINKVGSGIGIVDNNLEGVERQIAENIYAQIAERLLIFPFYGYSPTSVKRPITTWKYDVLLQLESAYANTHGFPGALAFQYLNDKVRKFPVEPDQREGMLRFIQDWAAVGILMHDMVHEYAGENDRKHPNPHFHLSFDTDPLSCLVAMADILEEFGRPSAKFHNGIDNSTISYEYPCISTGLNIKGSKMEIIYRYSAPPSRKVRNDRIDEINSYFNSKDGYIDMSTLGIDEVQCVIKC